MRLWIVRHGIAEEPHETKWPDDSKRPLTPDGLGLTKTAAKGLRKLRVKPEVILTSPFLRAHQTSQILAEILELEEDRIQITDLLLPACSPQQTLAALTHRPEANVLLVGHAPHLDRFISLAIGSTRENVTSLKKAGAARLDLDLRGDGDVQLTWVMTAGALRRLGKS